MPFFKINPSKTFEDYFYAIYIQIISLLLMISNKELDLCNHMHAM